MMGGGEIKEDGRFQAGSAVSAVETSQRGEKKRGINKKRKKGRTETGKQFPS